MDVRVKRLSEVRHTFNGQHAFAIDKVSFRHILSGAVAHCPLVVGHAVIGSDYEPSARRHRTHQEHQSGEPRQLDGDDRHGRLSTGEVGRSLFVSSATTAVIANGETHQSIANANLPGLRGRLLMSQSQTVLRLGSRYSESPTAVTSVSSSNSSSVGLSAGVLTVSDTPLGCG